MKRNLSRIAALSLVACGCTALTASVYAACWGKQFQAETTIPVTCGEKAFGYCDPDDCSYRTFSPSCFWCGTAEDDQPATGMRLAYEEPVSVTVYTTTGTCQIDWLGCDDCDYHTAVTVADPGGAACWTCYWTNDGC